MEDFSINLTKILDITLNKNTRTFKLNGTNEIYRFLMLSNHQLTYPKNDYIDIYIKNANNKLEFFLDLWYEAIKSASLNMLPSWY